MSGTSLDGIDGALVRWHRDTPTTLAFASRPMPAALRAELLRLQSPSDDELHRSRLAGVELARAYAEVCAELIAQAPDGERVRAIGAHGQTIRHRPDSGYTLQILEGALLAELTGCDVVCDLRSADVAARGQGAPLVPAFHARVFGAEGRARAIVNLGGIANVTLLAADGGVRGHDTGPANVLLDLWAERWTGQPFDRDGALAATGRCDENLLGRLLDEPYFALPPPKSTGRDTFNAAWLERRLTESDRQAVRAADVQATLLELTALTVARDCLAGGVEGVWLCGGGAANPVLQAAIARRCAPLLVQTTLALGAPPQAVEAVAFAWLAKRRLEGRPGNLPAVTGASGPRVLGALYPGR
ncbi:MAG: anhydro-N-acetylmuramic acid kinase [Rubrivivax sp.]